MTVYFIQAGHDGPVKIGYTRERVQVFDGVNPLALPGVAIQDRCRAQSLAEGSSATD